MTPPPRPGPLEFYDQLQRVIRQGREHAEKAGDAINAVFERVVLNRVAVQLVCEAMGDGTTAGAVQLPAVVLLGQPGHVGFVDGCKLYYDPRLDRDAGAVMRYLARTESDGA